MSQKDTILYAHGSAYNHGCEAIVRASAKLLSLEREHTVLYSNKIDGDIAFHLDDIVTVKPIAETPVPHKSPLGISYRMRSRLHSDHVKYYHRYFGEHRFEYLYGFGKIAISIGGDNYCYPSAIRDLDIRNYWLNKKGFKTMLWGASLTEEFMTPDIVEDLNRYALITVREKKSLDLLKKKGVRTEIVCGPDPAFALDVEETPWPDGKEHGNVIGVNISPFVMGGAALNSIGMRNYVNLINWILAETDCEVALIPHVVFPESDSNDILTARQLMQYLPENDRVFMLDDRYNCCQLKSLISKCRFFIGARTHSTIAAYSTFVPTIVVGYSSKSIGIARDLFGTEQDYVCSVQNMTDDNVLVTTFCKMFAQENELRCNLRTIMPDYLKGHQICVDAANALLR